MLEIEMLLVYKISKIKYFYIYVVIVGVSVFFKVSVLCVFVLFNIVWYDIRNMFCTVGFEFFEVFNWFLYILVMVIFWFVCVCLNFEERIL